MRRGQIVDAMLRDGSCLRVVISQIIREHMAVCIRKFVLGLHSLDELVATGSAERPGGTLPRSQRRGRAEHPRIGRDAGQENRLSN